MSNKNTNPEIVAEDATVIAPSSKIVLDPYDAAIVPDNKLTRFYLLEEQYELLEFRTRSCDEAKDYAKELRNQGKLTAYITLHQGWYGVFAKDKPVKVQNLKNFVAKKEIPMVVKYGETELTFSSTKEARNFARIIVEQARQAEYNADLAEAKARKEATN